MAVAVAGLLPVKSPPRYLLTTHYLTVRSEVDSWAARDIALVAAANRGGTTTAA